MDKSQIMQDVIDRIKVVAQKEIEITADSRFEDMGLDSLDRVDIVMGLEEKYKITLGDESNVPTVGEFVDVVATLVK